MTEHNIPPVFDINSKVLILGSFPSVRSREECFFYGHPMNRFWKVLSAVLDTEMPVGIEEKRSFLLSNGIALWDVIGACDVMGSSDSSIKNVVPNDLSVILNACDIRSIYTNGKTAEKFYNKYIKNRINRSCICLPSTSPANAAWSTERLINEWMQIKGL